MAIPTPTDPWTAGIGAISGLAAGGPSSAYASAGGDMTVGAPAWAAPTPAAVAPMGVNWPVAMLAGAALLAVLLVRR